MGEKELIHAAVKALLKKLGPVETVRFLGLKPKLHLDSITRHRKWQDEMDKDLFMKKVFGEI
jgi:hypothetical protein